MAAHRWDSAHPDVPPGVLVEDAAPESAEGFRTGQPAFLGLTRPAAARAGRSPRLSWLTRRGQLTGTVFESAGSFLGEAVRGFFDNGGERCVVVPWALEGDIAAATPEQWAASLEACLARLEGVEDVDLVCAPDAARAGASTAQLQCRILKHCEKMRNRFAILDSRAEATPDQVLEQWQDLLPTDGALYYPWIRVVRPLSGATWLPPCGHLAGIYARTDARFGVHKAPANAAVEGAVDVRVDLTDEQQRVLNGAGVNCVRAFHGRGLRVWGARTLSGRAEWRYVNVRRLFMTLTRWMATACRDLVFESNDPRLWSRIRDRVNGYCYELFQRGALKGPTAADAFFVKCDAETNPPATRDLGEVKTEIGLAPLRPAEFIVVRVTQSAAGTAMESTSLTE